MCVVRNPFGENFGSIIVQTQMKVTVNEYRVTSS